MLTQSLDILFLLGSLIAYYIASRAAVGAVDDHVQPSPGRQAMGFALPIALVALITAGAGQGRLAVTVIFSTAVASLTLVMGLSLFMTSGGKLASRGVWALVLPTALLAWLIGFDGRLTGTAVAVLLIEGAAVAGAWASRHSRDEAIRNDPIRIGREVTSGEIVLRVAQLLLAVALAVIGAWMTIYSAGYVTRQSPLVSQGLFGAVVVAPMLVLPMIGVGAGQAQRGKLSLAMGAQIGVVLLNLCVTLPLTAVVWWLFHGGQGPLIFPLGVWRIDNVALIVLGAMVLCFSLGLCRPRRLIGAILLIAYLAYVSLALRAAAGI